MSFWSLWRVSATQMGGLSVQGWIPQLWQDIVMGWDVPASYDQFLVELHGIEKVARKIAAEERAKDQALRQFVRDLRSLFDEHFPGSAPRSSERGRLPRIVRFVRAVADEFKIDIRCETIQSYLKPTRRG